MDVYEKLKADVEAFGLVINLGFTVEDLELAARDCEAGATPRTYPVVEPRDSTVTV